MEALKVRADEVGWVPPKDQGIRTPYYIMRSVCRHKVLTQLDRYLQLGYIRECSISERVFLSPLLPIEKKDGSYRLCTDFRVVNHYFASGGTEQPSVWFKLWEIKRSWRFFLKVDLKEAFLSVPITDSLSGAFGFSWGSRRFIWRRLPEMIVYVTIKWCISFQVIVFTQMCERKRYRAFLTPAEFCYVSYGTCKKQVQNKCIIGASTALARSIASPDIQLNTSLS